MLKKVDWNVIKKLAKAVLAIADIATEQKLV